MKTIRILNLGAGEQSTCVYLMAAKGEIEPFDYAIFADTGEEPRPVYGHLQWLQCQPGCPILIRSLGVRLGDQLVNGFKESGRRFSSIPAFTAKPDGLHLNTGITRRQCTAVFKAEVVERAIRREILGVEKGGRLPKDVRVIQAFGLSMDEPNRIIRTRARIEAGRLSSPEFPLLDLEMERSDCRAYNREHVPHPVPRSACTFCPYRGREEWLWLQEHDPDGWDRAVEIDRALRTPGNIVNEGLDDLLYVHRSCVPLDEVDFRTKDERRGQRTLGFLSECEGMCGV